LLSRATYWLVKITSGIANGQVRFYSRDGSPVWRDKLRTYFVYFLSSSKEDDGEESDTTHFRNMHLSFALFFRIIFSPQCLFILF
jgi:hypothetical protein